MIQFTLGCILLAMTLFFGGKEVLSNNDVIKNRTNSLSSQENKVSRASSVKSKYEAIKNDTIVFSDDIKKNLINQLNIDEEKYVFNLTEPAVKTKVLTIYTFDFEGFDSFPKIFSLVSDIEKIKGLQLLDVCFNCEVKNEKLIQRKPEIGFKIKGKAYVYNQEK